MYNCNHLPLSVAKTMAIKHGVSLLLVSLAIFFQGSEVSARETVFTLKNLCSDTIWPGTLTGNNGAVLGGGGFSLAPGASNQFPAPAGWSGRFWARTGCKFDGSGNGKCNTGDCGNKLNCTGSGGVPPVTLAEFTIGSRDNHFTDFYDVSLVDGYNVGIGIRPSNGNGDCKYAGCVADLNANCPPELEVTSAGSGVACKSACAAFNTPEYCCTGDHATPATCPPTQYSKLFKRACPDAYSYAYDDETNTFTCSVADYLITFCPSGTQLLQMENPENHILSSIISNYRLLLQKLRSGVKHIFREAINAPML